MAPAGRMPFVVRGGCNHHVKALSARACVLCMRALLASSVLGLLEPKSQAEICVSGRYVRLLTAQQHVHAGEVMITYVGPRRKSMGRGVGRVVSGLRRRFLTTLVFGTLRCVVGQLDEIPESLKPLCTDTVRRVAGR